MAMVAVSIAPLGTGDTSVGRYVAVAEKVLRDNPKIRYQLGPMFTTIEGDLRDILECIARMHDAVAATGAARISTVIKIDDRRDKSVSMEAKVQSVMDHRAAPDQK